MDYLKEFLDIYNYKFFYYYYHPFLAILNKVSDKILPSHLLPSPTNKSLLAQLLSFLLNFHKTHMKYNSLYIYNSMYLFGSQQNDDKMMTFTFLDNLLRLFAPCWP